MKNQSRIPISNRGFDAQILGTVPYYNPLFLNGVIASVDSVRMKYTYSKFSYDFEKNECNDGDVYRPAQISA